MIKNKDRFLGRLSILYYLIISFFVASIHFFLILFIHEDIFFTGFYSWKDKFDFNYWVSIIGFIKVIFLLYWFIPILILIIYIKKYLKYNKEILFFVILLIFMFITYMISYFIYESTINCTGRMCLH